MRRAMALIIAACAMMVTPVGAQTRSVVHASAQVVLLTIAPSPAIVAGWVSEWRVRETERAGASGAAEPGRPAVERRIDSGIWTATLAEQCEAVPARRPCGVVVTVTFPRN